MKYALILCDGMADYPIKELSNLTPLQVAIKSNIDSMLFSSKIGLVKTVPDGFLPGSDVANLGALGYDARECYTGRSPLEALSIGIDMLDSDVAIRTNFVCLSDEDIYEQKTMIDYSAGEISSAEAKELIEFLHKNLSDENIEFYAGVSYRNCMILSNGSINMKLTPPHDITAKPIKEHLPKGDFSDTLLNLMKESYLLLKDHPVNKNRIAKGMNPANSIWLWGQGTKPTLQSFEEKYNKTGGMISAVDLLKGIAIGSKMKSVDVEGATGTIHTNFDGKAQAMIDLFEEGIDFVFIHIEAPDECGHQGDLKGKIKAIEIIDDKIIGRVRKHFESTNQDFAMLIMPDHYTPLSTLTHSSEPVPFMMYSSTKSLGSAKAFSEAEAGESGNYYEKPWCLIKEFLAL